MIPVHFMFMLVDYLRSDSPSPVMASLDVLLLLELNLGWAGLGWY